MEVAWQIRSDQRHHCDQVERIEEHPDGQERSAAHHKEQNKDSKKDQ